MRAPHFLAILLALMPSLCGEAAVPYVELGGGRRQGDFGTSIQNTLWMGYANAGCFGERWDVSLTVPYLGLERSAPGYYRLDQGLGDIVLQGAWRFLPETWEGWSLDGISALKCPTADKDKGLGTGRTDLGAFLALNQQVGVLRWTLLGGWIQGVSRQSGDELTPGAYVFNASTSLTFERSHWEVAFEAHGPSYQGAAGARELSLNLSFNLSPVWAVKASAMAGLTDASPKQSYTLALIRFFPN